MLWILFAFFLAIFSIFGCYLLSKYASLAVSKILVYTCTIYMIASYFYCYVVTVHHGRFDIGFDLPLHLCSFQRIAIVAALFFRNQLAFDMSLHFGAVGGLMGVFFPLASYLEKLDSSIIYYCYFIDHYVLYLIPIIMYFGLRCRSSKKAVNKVTLLLLVIFMVVFTVDWALGANYIYLMENTTGNALVFGPWPYYLICVNIYIYLISYLIKALTNLYEKRSSFPPKIIT